MFAKQIYVTKVVKFC